MYNKKHSNMPPASASHRITPDPNRGLGLTSFLGTDYQKKKQKLLSELQEDYKDFATKKTYVKCLEPQLQQQGLSLPIYERESEKERLREERNKEYNIFLQEQAHLRKLKSGTPSVTSKTEQIGMSDAMNVTFQGPPLAFLNTPTNIPPPPMEYPASRKDVATVTDTVDSGRNMGTWNAAPRRRRRWQIHRPREPHSSEEELHAEDDEFEVRCRRRENRWAQKPEYKEEKRAQERRANSALRDIKGEQTPAVHDQNITERIRKSDKQMSVSMRAAGISTAECATGLIIGAPEELKVTQMRKEHYKQELLRQIAEKKRNKIREKTLELRVAASGATDPEKRPDRIKQLWTAHRQSDSITWDAPHKSLIDLGAVRKNTNSAYKHDNTHENTEHRAHPVRSQMDFSHSHTKHKGKTFHRPGKPVVQDVPPIDFFSEDNNSDFTRLQGEVTLPRDDDLDTPPPPTERNTPYDAAFYNYGARNPFDIQTHNQNGLSAKAQRSRYFEIPPQNQTSFRPNNYTDTSLMTIEGRHEDKFKQRKQSLRSYQDALREQIEERKERKRREKEETERLDAKIEAELLVYNPWGRSGGGAPIKDQNGNLISDLSHMQRINKNNSFTAGVEDKSPLSLQVTGCNDLSSPRQLHKQDRYKEDLKQQIEEKKRKQAEERERIRIAIEKEEKRLAKERARIQQEYEEEQRKQKRPQNNQKTPLQIPEPKTHHREKEKSTKQQKDMLPQIDLTREKKTSPFIYERAPSPPIPTLQRKQAKLVTLSSDVSKLSSSTDRSVSAPHDRPVPVRIPPLDKEKQEVIRELSALRKYLRKEQRQLELQRCLTGPPKTPYSPTSRCRMAAFEHANEESVQPSPRRAAPAADVDEQNMTDLNQRKYREKEKRASQESEEGTSRTKASIMGTLTVGMGARDTSSPRCRLNSGPQTSTAALYSDPGGHHHRSGLCFEEVDALSLCSALGRCVSVDTVATDYWLRPETSDTVKHLDWGEKTKQQDGCFTPDDSLHHIATQSGSPRKGILKP